MITQILTKTVAPQQAQMRSMFEIWFYGLINAGLVGGATAVSSAIGLAAAHGMGVADIPQVNWDTIGVVFCSGAVSKLAFYLAQGLPALKRDQDMAPGGSGS